jgi:hypothetical protein
MPPLYKSSSDDCSPNLAGQTRWGDTKTTWTDEDDVPYLTDNSSEDETTMEEEMDDVEEESAEAMVEEPVLRTGGEKRNHLAKEKRKSKKKSKQIKPDWESNLDETARLHYRLRDAQDRLKTFESSDSDDSQEDSFDREKEALEQRIQRLLGDLKKHEASAKKRGRNPRTPGQKTSVSKKTKTASTKKTIVAGKIVTKKSKSGNKSTKKGSKQKVTPTPSRRLQFHSSSDSDDRSSDPTSESVEIDRYSTPCVYGLEEELADVPTRISIDREGIQCQYIPRNGKFKSTDLTNNSKLKIKGETFSGVEADLPMSLMNTISLVLEHAENSRLDAQSLFHLLRANIVGTASTVIRRTRTFEDAVCCLIDRYANETIVQAFEGEVMSQKQGFKQPLNAFLEQSSTISDILMPEVAQDTSRC